ncbi:MAG: hypothetical protein QHG99_01445 [Methanomicrobiales archaeon]|nr:hypothetical protein [Methanomicrobiales archaeon]
MNYYIVFRDGDRRIVLDSFDSKDKADRFLRSMRFWFSRPFQLEQVTGDGHSPNIIG